MSCSHGEGMAAVKLMVFESQSGQSDVVALTGQAEAAYGGG